MGQWSGPSGPAVAILILAGGVASFLSGSKCLIVSLYFFSTIIWYHTSFVAASALYLPAQALCLVEYISLVLL